jgi:hypothetical protein
MLEKSFGLLFFMRKPKNYKTGLLPIYLKITVDGQPKELSAKRKWDPAKWSTAAGRAMGTKEESRELNYYLNALEHLIKLILKPSEIIWKSYVKTTTSLFVNWR